MTAAGTGSAGRVGVWFVGAWGGVATTAAVGLAALKTGMTPSTGLVTELPFFADLDLAGWNDFVVGGHEIRQTNWSTEAKQLLEQSHVFHPAMLEALAPALAEWDRNVRPGTLIGAGEKISSFAGGWMTPFGEEKSAAAIRRLTADLMEFKSRHRLDRLIVVNVASTEPPVAESIKTAPWNDIASRLAAGGEAPLPASSLYAVAAFEAGAAHVNFTPSIGTDCRALEELAIAKHLPHCGRDGKTGETLMKAVLAPMFAARNLQVMSWVGHNIFGNMDGKVLDDPVNKANKVRSKDHLLTEILGYKPQTLVSIEYIESMGDWKTAWDHIHFRGFLGTPMVLQFIWQGCDSLLAAPLVLDLVRLTERELRRGGSGVMGHLGAFFKSPMGCDEPAFALQFEQLKQWAETVRGASESKPA